MTSLRHNTLVTIIILSSWRRRGRKKKRRRRKKRRRDQDSNSGPAAVESLPGPASPVAEFLSLMDFFEIPTAFCEYWKGPVFLAPSQPGLPAGLGLLTPQPPAQPGVQPSSRPAVQPDSRALKEQGTLRALYILGLFLTSALSTLRSFLSPVRRKPYLAVLPVNTRPWDD